MDDIYYCFLIGCFYNKAYLMVTMHFPCVEIKLDILEFF